MADGSSFDHPDFSKIPPNQRHMALYNWHTGKKDYGNMYEHFKNCPTCSELLEDIKKLKYVNLRSDQYSTSPEILKGGGGASGEM